MSLEELTLGLQGRTDGLVVLNVSLTTVDYWYISQSQRDDPASENIDNVRSLVPEVECLSNKKMYEMPGRYSHQVDLRQDTNRPLTLRINLSCQLQPIRVRQVRVGCGDSKNDTSWSRDILEQHVPDLLLNIARLVADWNLCQARQIDEREGEDIRREDAQVDGKRGDACILARLRFRIPNNFLPDLVEIVELLTGEVQEFTPFIRVGFGITPRRQILAVNLS